MKIIDILIYKQNIVETYNKIIFELNIFYYLYINKILSFDMTISSSSFITCLNWFI